MELTDMVSVPFMRLISVKSNKSHKIHTGQNNNNNNINIEFNKST